MKLSFIFREIVRFKSLILSFQPSRLVKLSFRDQVRFRWLILRVQPSLRVKFSFSENSPTQVTETSYSILEPCFLETPSCDTVPASYLGPQISH